MAAKEITVDPFAVEKNRMAKGCPSGEGKCQRNFSVAISENVRPGHLLYHINCMTCGCTVSWEDSIEGTDK